jgi:periplasmic divalent cation tolerance protein
MKILLCYTTFADKDDATKVINALLDSRTIACANVGSITSFYEWKEERVSDSECSCIIKTRTVLKDKLRDELSKLHPYQNPAILFFEVETTVAYHDWVYDMTK